jgi:hypothetical protein
VAAFREAKFQPCVRGTARTGVAFLTMNDSDSSQRESTTTIVPWPERIDHAPPAEATFISEPNRFAVLCRADGSRQRRGVLTGRIFCGEAVARGSVKHTLRVGVTGEQAIALSSLPAGFCARLLRVR